jgi:hypothetical protein
MKGKEMPYVTRGYRDEMDQEIEALVKKLYRWSDGKAADGTVNYAITKIIRAMYPPVTYQLVNSGIGVLECVKQEYYRTGAAAYEEEKRMLNGDVT